jgi:hypothetical protein
VVERWDGKSWSAMSVPHPPGSLWSVLGSLTCYSRRLFTPGMGRYPILANKVLSRVASERGGDYVPAPDANTPVPTGRAFHPKSA